MRPTKCSPDVIQKLCSAIEIGLSFSSACEYAGIAESTGYLWLERAEAGEQPFSEFMEQVSRAQAHGEIALLQTIHEASKKHWSAAAWILERRHPTKWGKHAAAPHDAYELLEKQDRKAAKEVRAKTDREIEEAMVEMIKHSPEILSKVFDFDPHFAEQAQNVLRKQ